METYREAMDKASLSLQKAVKALAEAFQEFCNDITDRWGSIKEFLKDLQVKRDKQDNVRNSWHTPLRIVPVKQVFNRKPKMVHARSCC